MERQEEKLIEQVRSYPALYDTNDYNYMKSKYKQEIWIKIGTDLNTNGKDVKSTWLKLRNNHRDALRRQKRMIKSGAVAADIKPWKFQSQMEFLLQYMANENRETNFNNDDDYSESLQDHLGESQRFNDQIADENEELAQPNVNLEVTWNSFDSSNESAQSIPKKRPKKKLKKIENLRKKRSKERDDLQLFFMSMYELTKKMSPSSQHIVRRNIFLSVSQEEARLLNISEPSLQQQISQDISTKECSACAALLVLRDTAQCAP